MKFKAPETSSVDIDMTPMIDIVFQLITFFMVVINFDAAETDERVKMAKSELARPLKVKPESEFLLQVGYDRKGGTRKGPFLFFNGGAIPAEELSKQLPIFLKADKRLYRLKHPKGPITTVVVIRADAECPTGKVQELIKICQENEYEKFSLKAMQPEPQ